MIVRSRAPLRVSFGGGGTDVAPYVDERGGAVVNVTINRYVYVTVASHPTIKVSSIDYEKSVDYEPTAEFVYGSHMDLALGIIDHFRKGGHLKGGVAVRIHSDAPPGSGLGMSSTVAVALLSALARFCDMPLSRYELAEKAVHIERVELGQRGGRQDQYAAAFGGFNYIEFSKEGATVRALQLEPASMYELQYRMVFAYIGGQRVSSDIIAKQQANYEQGKEKAIHAMDELKRLSRDMRDALLANELDRLASLVGDAWRAKKNMADEISNPRIDALYDAAHVAGAVSGKISGAGGGGFMFFLCDPLRRSDVEQALKDKGASVANLDFHLGGVETWILTDEGKSIQASFPTT